MRDDSEKVPALLTDYILKGKHTLVFTNIKVEQCKKLKAMKSTEALRGKTIPGISITITNTQNSGAPFSKSDLSSSLFCAYDLTTGGKKV